MHREITTMHEVHGEGDVRIPEDIENIDTELEGDCLKSWENMNISDKLKWYFIIVMPKEKAIIYDQLRKQIQ